MLAKEILSIITFKAISPIHAGSGFSTSSVDLPIQREKHTGWPHIQASAVKGAARDHFRNNGLKKDEINYIFGSDKNNDGDKKGNSEEIPSAISISDAKLLFFPMRSNKAPFVYVTCPSVLKRFKRDLEFVGLSEEIKINYNEKLIESTDEKETALCLAGNLEGKVVLEDIVVDVNQKKATSQLEVIKDLDLDNVLLISDEVFDYCVTSCTEIQTNITIDSTTGTAKDGSLRYQELLPSDTVLYSVIYFSNALNNNNLQAKEIQDYIKESLKGFIQLGGDETLGRGLCKIKWLGGKNE